MPPCLCDHVNGSILSPCPFSSSLSNRAVSGCPGPTSIFRQLTDCTTNGDGVEADGEDREGVVKDQLAAETAGMRNRDSLDPP